MDKQAWLSKLGQMLVAGFHGKTVDDTAKRLIHDYRIGNIILFRRNIGTPEEVRELTAGLQSEAKKAGHAQPLLICTDQENGIVRRLKDPTTAFPGPMSLGAAASAVLARQIGKATGEELKELGINWNLAPVVDVNNNPGNPVINVRSFGSSPEQVAQLSSAWMKGLQAAGVASTLKHFPGHGDTAVDSHLDLPVINYSLERLYEIELVPFIEGIKQGTDVVMNAHIYFSALEKEFGKPATLSANVLTELLRKKLGFKGVITTDCLEMNAIKSTVGVAGGAVQAIQAGADFAMISHTFSYQAEAMNALVTAVEEGRISEDQVNESLGRIKRLKDKAAGTWEAVMATGAFEHVGSAAHHELAREVYEQSVCLVNGGKSLPFSEQKTLAIYPKTSTFNQAEDPEVQATLDQILSRYPLKMELHEMDPAVSETTENLALRAQEYDQVIIFTQSIAEDDYLKTIQPLGSMKNAAVISLRGPYPQRNLEEMENMVCVYDSTPMAVHAALDVVFGIHKATGQLPVSI